ncbi:hypothetical protein QTJ16_005888 [Diplocarpon rosae]|uniref:CFEM domain-containing protein n=1 Tax=Diplocarpon rosae TaxID=946125 RepID=A0AAD9SXZ1_9HELO|nr:hypothetical protein QTJ16_005888 [Diplocarpon rosae]
MGREETTASKRYIRPEKPSCGPLPPPPPPRSSPYPLLLSSCPLLNLAIPSFSSVRVIRFFASPFVFTQHQPLQTEQNKHTTLALTHDTTRHCISPLTFAFPTRSTDHPTPPPPNMKSTFSAVVALAVTAERASATFSGASPFSNPYNTNNECNTQQSSGFDWSSLDLGSFADYGDFSFSGFSCAGSFGSGQKRDVLTGRTFQDKCITGEASAEISKSPSFGCGSSSSVKDFSVTEFQVSTEFDCDLEFHYEMPDKSSCKQKSFCSAGGSVVKNEQCGGAVSVTVVYPSQTTGPGLTKTACSLGVHSMSFDCNAASSTVVASTTSTTRDSASKNTPATLLATTTSVPRPTLAVSSSAAASSKIQIASSSSVASAPETTPAAPSSTAIESSSSSASIPGTTTTPGNPSYPANAPGTTPVAENTRVVNSTSSQMAPSSPIVLTTSSASSESVPTSTVTVSYPVNPVASPIESTSSVAGVVSTPVSSLPALVATATASLPPVDVVTVVISTSTTVCPVTLTHVTGGSTSTIPTTISYTSEGLTSYEVSSYASVYGGTTSLEVGTTTSTIMSTLTSTVCTKCQAAPTSPIVGQVSSPVSSPGISSPATTSPAGPVETAPCPDVLPSCLNSWMFTEGCASNTDADCYCPSESFVTKVFQCLTAHGADDAEVDSAKTYFQGICAAHIPSNPAIVTAAPPAYTPAASSSSAVGGATTPAAVPSYPANVPGTTVAPSYPSQPSVPVTTIQVYSTFTVPLVESTGINSGSVIPSRYVTTTISTAVTVPQVVFQTYAGSASVAVDLVVAVTPASGPAYPTSSSPVGSTTLVPYQTRVSNGTLQTTATPVGFVSAGVRHAATLGLASVALLLAVLAV